MREYVQHYDVCGSAHSVTTNKFDAIPKINANRRRFSFIMASVTGALMRVKSNDDFGLIGAMKMIGRSSAYAFIQLLAAQTKKHFCMILAGFINEYTNE